MQLVEQHIVTTSSPYFKECDELCLKSKNLYNSMLYAVRQSYIKDKTNILFNLHHLFKDSEPYKLLPAKVSSSVLLMVQKNFKSFFKSISDYSLNPQKYKGRPGLPYYLDKEKGRFLTAYTNQAISKKIFKKTNKIKLSSTNIEFKTKLTDFQSIDCVRIVPRESYYVIEVVYTIPDTIKLPDNNRYLSIDLGVNNLATITSNVKELKPIIVNGKPLKSINQYYNKKLAHYNSKLEKVNKLKSSKKLNKLHLKRKNKVDNYLHKSSKYIVNHCKENNVNTLIIGKNDYWKQKVNMHKDNNQNFVHIPHSRFISMLTYKCEIVGIRVMIQEESYSSKSSFLDLDPIPIYGKDNQDYSFSGYRKSRGMYKSKTKKKLINADVNGSYNILRKAIPNAFADGIEGFGVIPKVITV